ncbi:hypothetical protein WMY93_012867 [Mugilogobius chulae]|uniref:DIS3-like exonuclease 1 n=1 Tax=Mugilogobius chulae TaxID=88201 RepID=A0AAW0P4U9_9GOBI
MIKTEKILHLKSSRGRKVRVVREHYLREKIPCFSALCQADCDNNEGKVLPGDLTHYVVPDVGIVLDFQEILEFREIQGIIFTQTACQAVQHNKGRRQYNRLRNLLKDPRHDCVLFANEFQEYSYCPREKGESQEKWQTRCVYSAAVWYYNHLAGLKDIVMVTDDAEAVAQYSSLNSGVYVITMKARARATTYYLADRRYDMLPEVLSANLCSLLGGVDRYAMSVLWELDADSLEVKNVWFGRTLIRSSYQLHYELAQALLNGDEAEVPELDKLKPEEKDERLIQLIQALETLTHVARHLRAQRDRGGALELEGVEVRAQLDSEKNITALVPRQPLEVHETVAECMIFANHWVARKIQESFPHQALLRHHPPPRQEHFSQLQESARARGFTIDTRSNKSLADSLEQALDPQDPVVNRLLRMMATQAMSQAMYFSTGAVPTEQYYHYGLALDRYTHFTSPIRRYADVIVHRLLTAALEQDRGLSVAVASNRELEETSQHINNRNRAAQHAQKLSTELFQCLFFRDRDPQTDPTCVSDAVIYAIRDNGLLVFVPQYGVKGPVYLRSREGLVVTAGADGSCEWSSGTVKRHSDHITTSSVSGSATFSLFQHITVRISVQSNRCHADSLNLEVIRNTPHETPDPDPGQSQSRVQLVQEVRRQAEEASLQKASLKPKLSREERHFCQSKQPNLYSLLEEIRELSLMDAEASAKKLCATTA